MTEENEQSPSPPTPLESVAGSPSPVKPRQPFTRRKLLIAIGIAVASFFVLILLLDDVVMPLYVMRGAKATVPQCVGLTTDAAIERLKDAGYEPVQYEVRFDEKSPEGTIVRETPEGGEETKPGRKVYLIISGGKEMAQVPDLYGKSLRDAKILLLKSNMSAANISYDYFDSVPSGMVARQTPTPGTKTSASAQVSLVVSQGPLLGRVPVPNLVKLTLAEAIEKLTSVKLQIGKVNYQNGTPENEILDQYPPVGDLVNEGATVDVFVARGGLPATPDNAQ
jgi:serine/threonine-protein kinase